MKRRPRDCDENNYEKFISLEKNRAMTFCVECDAWHQTVLQATASIEVRAWQKRPQINKIDLETVSLSCGACGVDIEYLLKPTPALRTQVIKHILGDFDVYE